MVNALNEIQEIKSRRQNVMVNALNEIQEIRGGR